MPKKKNAHQILLDVVDNMTIQRKFFHSEKSQKVYEDCL